MTITVSQSNVTLDQTVEGYAAGSVITITGGNVTFTAQNALVEPEGDGDTLIGTPYATQLLFGAAPTGVTVDFSTGTIQNGFGGTDHFSNFNQAIGSARDDTFITSASGGIRFFGSAGNDTYVGSGSGNQVAYFNGSSTGADIRYDGDDNWTITKHFSDGTTGVDTLTGIQTVQFSDALYYRGTRAILPALSQGQAVQEVVALPIAGSAYPALVVLKWNPDMLQPAAVQVMMADSTGLYSDKTASFFSGAVPTVLEPRNFVVGDFNGDGQQDLLIANQGNDYSPWQGAQSTLILSNGKGQFTDASGQLPQLSAFSHGAAGGVINAQTGQYAIYLSNVSGQAQIPPELLLDDGSGKFTLADAKLPAPLQLPPNQAKAVYTAAALIDVNGDGAADLLVGTEDQSNLGASLIYLNSGSGDFSKATPIALPASPLASSRSPVTSNLEGAGVMWIAPIHLTNGGPQDLVVISTTASYTGYAIQILVNDGAGHFTDETASRIAGTSSDTAAAGANNGSYWLKRAYVVNLNGYDDIITQSAQGTGTPSQVLLNDGTGHFTVAYTSGLSILGVTSVNGVPNLVEGDYSSIFLKPYAAPPTLAHPLASQQWVQGQNVSMTIPADMFTGSGLTYTVTQADGSALPSWLTFDSASRTLSGAVPAGAGQLTIEVTAANSSDFFSTATMSVSLYMSAPLAAKDLLANPALTAMQVGDSAAHVVANLDSLQTVASQGKLASITLLDSGIPSLSVSAAQLTSDAAAIKAIGGYFSLNESVSSGVATVSGATNALGNTLILSGTAQQYAVTAAGDGVHFTISGNGSTVSANNVQALQFPDFTLIVAATPGSGDHPTTGNITELYGAVFGRLPDVAGLGYYQSALAQAPNTPLTTFAQQFLASPEYVNNPAHAYLQTTAGDTQFIDDLYAGLLHRAPASGDAAWYEANVIAPFIKGLTPGTAAYNSALATAHAYVVTGFSQSAEFLTDVQVTAQNPASAGHWLVLI